MWQIEYADVAEAALLALDKPVRTRLLDYMRSRVAVSEDPTNWQNR